MNMNKGFLKIGFIVLILTTGLLSGCVNEEAEEGKKKNTAVEQLELLHEEEMPDNMAMLIVNEPNKGEVDKIEHIKKTTLEEEGQQILIIPAYNGSNIKVVTVSMEDGSLIEEEDVFEQANTKDNSAVLLEVFRPEGMPQHKIIVEYEGENAGYLISYNGKEGTPHFEYVLKDTKVSEKNRTSLRCSIL